jgi:hypothetical protein
MLPYPADRAVNLHRYPDGVGSKGFWQRRCRPTPPEWLQRWRNPDETQATSSPTRLPPSLSWPTSDALELHPWTSKITAPDQPTWALFDIDPGRDDDFANVVLLARLHRTALHHLGVAGGPEITGKRGIQIWVPVARATRSPIPAGGSRRSHGRSVRPSLRRSAGNGRSNVAGASSGWTTRRTRSTRPSSPHSALDPPSAHQSRCRSPGRTRRRPSPTRPLDDYRRPSTRGDRR